MTRGKNSKKWVCGIHRIPDPTGLPRSVCGRIAHHSVSFISTEFSSRTKYVFPLCEEHFQSLQDEAGESWNRPDEDYEEGQIDFDELRFTFKKNRF